MTRINLVDPKALTDKHLLAEYKEITRPFNKMIKRVTDNNLPVDIPLLYVLGKGHETFFFNKLLFLWKRYGALYSELESRGYSLNSKQYEEISTKFLTFFFGTEFWNDYVPSPEELYLNMARLCKRSKLENVLEELDD